jgi:anthranilate synthase component 1
VNDAFTTPNVIPVVTTLPADLLTPLAVYLKLSGRSKYAFLLESVEGGRSLARYSFIGADPAFVIEAAENRTKKTSPDGVKLVDTAFYAYLRDHFSKFVASSDPDLPPFIGGALGFLGFDCCEWFEPTLSGGKPEATLMFYRSVVAFDHAKQIVSIISLVFTDDATDQAGLTALKNAAERRNDEIRHLLEVQPIDLPPNGRMSKMETTSNWDRADFENAVDRIKDLITAGEVYQAVLSQCFSRPTGAHPVAIYRALRSLNPSPYMFLLNLGDKAVIGASPEMLVRSTGDKLEYRPIAGTRPRGATVKEDEDIADEMRRDVKEVAEHLMLVDLGRNDLGRVAEFGSVMVDTLMNVEK